MAVLIKIEMLIFVAFNKKKIPLQIQFIHVTI
jgi:hypothetical protein